MTVVPYIAIIKGWTFWNEEEMNTNDLILKLPEELIAQTPLNNVMPSNSLVIGPVTKEMTDTHFDHIIDQFNPGDALVMNNTRVLPARLYGEKPTPPHVGSSFLKNTPRGSMKLQASRNALKWDG